MNEAIEGFGEIHGDNNRERFLLQCQCELVKEPLFFVNGTICSAVSNRLGSTKGINYYLSHKQSLFYVAE